MKTWNIHEIEALTEKEVLTMNPETVKINAHQVYFVDFGGYFGFSALVFRNGAHIYYANDYELHHKSKSREELKAWYLETMKTKIFDDLQVVKPSADYVENEKKEYYLRNYYPQMCNDKVSAFCIIHNDAESRAFDESIKGLLYSPVGFFYSSDKDFISRLNDLYTAQQENKKKAATSYEYWFEAFKHEMFNHEYAINWDADADTLSAFGNVPRSASREKMFDFLGFTDTQRTAYRNAAAYVLENSNY